MAIRALYGAVIHLSGHKNSQKVIPWIGTKQTTPKVAVSVADCEEFPE